MAGIPERCRKRRCGDAYAHALAETIALEAMVEQRLSNGDLPAITTERVSREVALKVGAYCSAECLGFIVNH